MRTKRDALLEVNQQLAESEKRIAEYPDKKDRWISQSYGYVMGIGYVYPELDEKLCKIWTDWHMKVR